MYKYFLGFSSLGLQNSLNYITRDAIVKHLTENNISYTFSLDDDFEIALISSGSDMFANYVTLKKKKVQIYIIAASNSSDFMIRWRKGKRELTLSLDAINYYRRADKLLVFLDSQRQFLSQFNIKTKIEKFPILHNDFSSNMCKSQENAFIHNFRLSKEREIIVSYGILSKKQTVMDLRAIARNSPEKDFLFFGDALPEALRQTTFEGMTMPDNLYFYSNLKEELYPSFLKNCSRLLLLGDYLAFPQLLIDCIFHKIPIITYKMSGYEELISPKSISSTSLYSTLYDVMNKPANHEKAEIAYQNIQKLK